jgi:hypothetical protein
MRSIAADQVLGDDLSCFAASEILGGCHHAGVVLHEVNDPRTAQDAHSGSRSSVREQYRFQVDLVDSMWRLGCRPPRVGPALRRIALGATRNRDARKLDPGRSGAEANVIGIVGGEASVAHSADHAEPAKDLHRACGNVVASHAGWFTGRACFGDDYFNAPPSEVHRQRQPDGSAADNQHLHIDNRRHY